MALSAGALWGCSGDYVLGRAEAPAEGGEGGETVQGSGGTDAPAGTTGKGVGGKSVSAGSSGTGGAGSGNSSGNAGEDPGGAPNGGTSGSSAGSTSAGTGNGGTGNGGTGGFAGGLAGTGGAPPKSSPITRIRLTATEKIDLLFMIDNSISMADKQAVMAEAVPVLLERLVTPRCVDENGVPTGDVTSTDGDCPSGAPEFPPVQDIHVGVITSSLGHHGSRDVCSDATGGRTPDDKAQLLGSVRGGLAGNESGFLTWQPGENVDVLSGNFADQVRAAGELGCGYESSLEAWYRFLVDPEPVDALDNDGLNTLRVGTNNTVLAQRAEFLRPDSLLAIVMLTDENDCSIIDEENTQGWLVGFKGGPLVNNWRMPASTASCQADPNDRCCRPCVIEPASGCPSNEEEACPDSSYLSIANDSMTQRCFEQRRRFGIDLLYPTSRYVSALRDINIDPRMNGTFVPNPLFQAQGELPGRSRDMVYLGGIIGVPWQDIATAESLSDPFKLEYLSARELWEGNRWGLILGNPNTNTNPSDPLMIESIDPRPTGAPHPLVPNAAVVAPGAAPTNAINGSEQSVDPQTRDDLQFACIFPLRTEVQCNPQNTTGCSCNADEAFKNSPLCRYPNEGEDGVQVAAKAYPGLRHLEVLQGAGESGIVASICPKLLPTAGDAATPDPNVGY
ncbi:MAG TPA: hypothetical protein VGK73_36505, partial [Polyangiaceae bacterium]